MVLNVESQPTTPTGSEIISSEALDAQARAFAANVFRAFENTMSDNERLSGLYQIDPEQFEEEVEKEVDDYLNEDPSYQEFFATFRTARLRGGGDSFVPEMKARRAKARELIINTLNIPQNSRIEGIEESKNHIQDLLKDIPKEPQNINLALSTLGVKVKVGDEPGEYLYSYPYDLLPVKANDKWRDYLEAVETHIEAAKNVTPETADVVVRADLARKLAHDSITRIVHSALQLDEFGVSELQTREVVAKMRNDELSLPRQQHKKVHTKTPEEIAVAKKLSKHH
ncbi:MAG: hypothetical protein JWO54_134 [Candidatus Saccharibacteria bacterium]|nr:hypothetical protein [Candidatus Saccharibacteria bacterium]